ncbi:MAG: KTSC domain-containing protein [Alphaproteobacteria bacterium HGW-Alphaproteobacteria-3]|nr:MAG: KTSC domain-containing protein [Alphaproteobacteria bacterium HGW-Alphaproteobacteria-3]
MPTFISSAIRRAEYNPNSHVLQIWFVDSGGPYDYFGVPQDIFDGLCRAVSKGTYFNDHIRDRFGR